MARTNRNNTTGLALARGMYDFDPPCKHRKKTPLDRLDKKCLMIKAYNEKHGTDYSYGQFDVLVRMKKIIWCDGEYEPAETLDFGR